MSPLLVLIPGILSAGIHRAPDPTLRHAAETSLRRGAAFFCEQVAVEGSYLWMYSADLSKREGEGVASAARGWVQPPGTPSVGMALLTAYEATQDSFYLDAARQTASALLQGQLQSGGWYYYIDFDPAGRKRLAYRLGGKESARNVTTLDDDTTQAALRFLLHLDRTLQFQDASVHECVQYALQHLLQAQYPNGAWPQGYSDMPDPSQFPVLKASFPETWPRTWPGSQQYWLRYTLNDNVLANMIQTMFEAGQIWSRPEAGATAHALAKQCRAAAEKAGDFLILAQLPEPQPAWAQQYDFDMHPCWARKFEPPAVTGGESQGALRILLKLYRETGHRKYLHPIPPALDYFRRSRWPDGRLARFYELGSNKPLFFTRDYQLTYSDTDAPTHYSFKVNDATPSIAREYERLANPDPTALPQSPATGQPQAGLALADQVKGIIAAQDSQGRWIEKGGLRYHRPKDPTVPVIRCATFTRNVDILSRFLAASRTDDRQ